MKSGNTIETFLHLTDTQWAAISTIVTLLAILVALFLPFYQDKRKSDNIKRVLLSEVKSNISLLEKANSFETLTDSIELMSAVTRHINLSSWREERQALAELSAEKYSAYKEVNDELEDILNYSWDIQQNKGVSSYSVFIGQLIKVCLEKAKKLE